MSRYIVAKLKMNGQYNGKAEVLDTTIDGGEGEPLVVALFHDADDAHSFCNARNRAIEFADLDPRLWGEYDSAAQWCAARQRSGNFGDPLPTGLSDRVKKLIDADPEAFMLRVREFAYARAMNKHVPEDAQ